jgi:hypothetical protein
MKTFLICQQSTRKHPVPAYQFWETYFKKGIEEAGYDWVEAEGVDWAEGLIYSEEKYLREWRDRTWNRTISYIKQQHQVQPINLFLTYLFPKQVEPSAVQEIQRLGIPCVNFFCDNVREFTRIPKEFYCFDLHWVPEFKAIEMYQQAGLNYVYAPMPVWIPPEQRICQHPENYGISFIGSRDIQREALLAQVLKLGVPLELRGAGWSQADTVNSDSVLQSKSLWKTLSNQIDFVAQNGISGYLGKATYKLQSKIPDRQFQDYVRAKPNSQEYVDIIQQSLITLGVNRYPSYRHPFSRPDTYSRMRDLEAPMMGACYLTEWTQGLDLLYELGEEIETYRTAEEMVEKIRKLEADPEKRKRMRCQAQQRALADHTVAKSLAKIINALGLCK